MTLLRLVIDEARAREGWAEWNADPEAEEISWEAWWRQWRDGILDELLDSRPWQGWQLELVEETT